MLKCFDKWVGMVEIGVLRPASDEGYITAQQPALSTDVTCEKRTVRGWELNPGQPIKDLKEAKHVLGKEHAIYVWTARTCLSKRDKYWLVRRERRVWA